MTKVNLDNYTPHHEGRHAKFVSEENRCKHIGNNVRSALVRQFKFDGEVIPKNADTDRCDYILLNDEAPAVYYIELKGSSIRKAIKQVEKSFDMCHESLPGYKSYFRIIYHSGTHDLKSRDVVNWQIKNKKSAAIKSRQYEEDI